MCQNILKKKLALEQENTVVYSTQWLKISEKVAKLVENAQNAKMQNAKCDIF